MTNVKKEKGDKFERAVLNTIQDAPLAAYRTFNAGIPSDAGDIHIRASSNVVVQCKNVVRLNLAEWTTDARRQANQAAQHALENAVGVVVVKRRGHSNTARSYVVCELGDFLTLIGRRPINLKEQP